MQRVIVLAVAILLVAFVSGQKMPQKPTQPCITLTSTQTSSLFCSAYAGAYAIPQFYDYVSKDFGAKAHYDITRAQIATPSQNCLNALTKYYCQYNFPRCGPYVNYTQVAAATCNSVVSACNITAFPGTFVGTPCVNNTLITVDNPAVCVPGTVGALNQACVTGTAFSDPMFIPPVTVQTVRCPFTSNCNAGSNNNGVCVTPNNLGDSCNSTCLAATGLPSATGSLSCLGGRCTYGGKRFGATCLANGECLSNNCTAGTCFESPLNGPCMTSLNCRDGLYCDSFNSTCYQIANNNEPCGQLQLNWAPVPCRAGLTCVRSNPNATATCQSNAELGGACAPQTLAIVYNAPICAPSTLLTSGNAQCINNVCTNVVPATLGQACNATVNCATSLTCKWDSPMGGTCANPSSVACDTAGSSNCNDNQVCNCGNGLNAQGTCAIDTTNPYQGCDLAKRALDLCINLKCRATPAYYPYDGSSCVDQQCRPLVNAWFCCAKTNLGSTFVPLTGQPADPCITPTPSAGPTTTGGPTGTPTGSPVPIQSSKKSGAATLAVSFIALIMAVVAFL